MKYNLASGVNGLIKSQSTLLVEAENKIGQIENEKRGLNEMVERLKWQMAYLRVAINALGRHFNLDPEEAKRIVVAYIAEQQAAYEKAPEEEKAKFVQVLKVVKAPEFKVLDGYKPEGS